MSDHDPDQAQFKKTLKIARGWFVLSVPISLGVAYLDNQGGLSPGSINCLFGFLIVTELLLIWVTTCALSCGSPGELLDPKCVWRCWRRFFIAEGLAILFLFACLIRPHIW